MRIADTLRIEARPVGDCIWEIPPTAKPGMHVPARIYASEALLAQMDAGVFEQVTNVACLPGIVRAALCMPDGHWGYGFPIGGVAAFRADAGVISPGGIGFDINCGMRVIRTGLTEDEVRPRLRELIDALFGAVPSGVGAKGFVHLTDVAFRKVMVEGAGWCVAQGYGWPEDLEHTEGRGCLPGADPAHVSTRAVSRGMGQLGTLGSGNHYLEIQVVPPDGIHDPEVAKAFGIEAPGQVFIMLHCGSRGFGHQIGTDYLRKFDQAMRGYGITVNDRELACAPFRSPEGQAYFGAMTAAANMAFANRQVIAHRVREVMVDGARWCIEHGYGWPADLASTEGGGCLPGVDPDAVSARAITRGMHQLGTLGSGNHYLEIQVVPPGGIHDARVAGAFGIERPGQVLVMLHCGSRGFGHQIGTDYLRRFDQAMHAYGITVRDRELACAPFRSPDGQAYFGAMTAAANAAFANRQVITHRVREVMGRVFGQPPEALGLSVIYDVCHNTAKVERHVVEGEALDLVVHRKGATRAFGPGAPDVPEAYRAVGQPVIIGGSMETGSALLVGTAHAMEETFGSTAHGAGRTMSRAQAKRRVWGETLVQDMAARGILVRAASKSGVAEEAGFAYKDLDAVVDVLHRLDISRKVVSLTPIGNIKG